MRRGTVVFTVVMVALAGLVALIVWDFLRDPPHVEAANAAIGRPAHYTMWLCVHRYERTAWNDPDPPYYGGLQLGEWFLGHYAHPRGTPDQWTPLQQMWVAENARTREVRERGARSIPGWLAHQWPPSVGHCF